MASWSSPTIRRSAADPQATVLRVDPRGLYDVLLELESDPTLGDLNDRKIVRRRSLAEPDGRRHVVTAEVRFPVWSPARRDERRRLAGEPRSLTVTVKGPNRTTTGTAPVDDSELRSHWLDVFYVDYEIELADHTTIVIENASLRVFGDSAASQQATAAWRARVAGRHDAGRLRRALPSQDHGSPTRRSGRPGTCSKPHRNLDEDYCRIDLVEIDEIAVCADVEVEATADIDLVQARIWYEIERYLDPPVEFWSLDELLSRGEPVEAIFNGPELDNGFLAEQGLRDTDLRTELRVSDIIDRLTDIDGVISVDNLLLTALRRQRQPDQGDADPAWARRDAAVRPQPDQRVVAPAAARGSPAAAAPRAVAVPLLEQRAAVHARASTRLRTRSCSCTGRRPGRRFPAPSSTCPRRSAAAVSSRRTTRSSTASRSPTGSALRACRRPPPPSAVPRPGS